MTARALRLSTGIGRPRGVGWVFIVFMQHGSDSAHADCTSLSVHLTRANLPRRDTTPGSDIACVRAHEHRLDIRHLNRARIRNWTL